MPRIEDEFVEGLSHYEALILEMALPEGDADSSTSAFAGLIPPETGEPPPRELCLVSKRFLALLLPYALSIDLIEEASGQRPLLWPASQTERAVYVAYHEVLTEIRTPRITRPHPPSRWDLHSQFELQSLFHERAIYSFMSGVDDVPTRRLGELTSDLHFRAREVWAARFRDRSIGHDPFGEAYRRAWTGQATTLDLGSLHAVDTTSELQKRSLLLDPDVFTLAGAAVLILGLVPTEFNRRTKEGENLVTSVRAKLWEYKHTHNPETNETEVEFHFRLLKFIKSVNAGFRKAWNEMDDKDDGATT